MALTIAIQEALLAILCFDEEVGGSKFVRGLVAPPLYDSGYREIAEGAAKFIDKFGKCPGTHTLDIVDTLCARRPDNEEYFRSIYESMLETRKVISRDYVIGQATKFVRTQKMRAASEKALELLEEGGEDRIDEAEAIVRKSMDDAIDLFDPGLFFHDADAVMKTLTDDVQALPTGIPELDALGLGPVKGRLHLYGGGAKSGKTWWLLALMKRAVMSGETALYVGLEVGKAVAARRLLMTFFSMKKRQAQDIQKQMFRHDDLGRFVSMRTKPVRNRPALDDPNAEDRIRQFLKRMRGRSKLLIKTFPTGSLTVQNLRAYLDGLEATGIIPGLLCLDYPDLMAIDSANYRHGLDEVYKGVRGIAQERNIAIAIVTQSSREGAKAKEQRAHHVSEDWRKVATADVYLTYSQTDDEKDLGLARLRVEMGREDASGFTILISQAYGIGQFCLDSVKLSSSYWSSISSEEKDDEDE